MGAIFSVGVVGAVAKLQPADLAATDDDIGGSDGEGHAEKDCERGDRCKSPPHRSHVTAPPHTCALGCGSPCPLSWGRGNDCWGR